MYPEHPAFHLDPPWRWHQFCPIPSWCRGTSACTQLCVPHCHHPPSPKGGLLYIFYSMQEIAREVNLPKGHFTN